MVVSQYVTRIIHPEHKVQDSVQFSRERSIRKSRLIGNIAPVLQLVENRARVRTWAAPHHLS